VIDRRSGAFVERVSSGRNSPLRQWSHRNGAYLISFDDGAMNIPEEAIPAVGEAAHAVVGEARMQVCGCSAAAWRARGRA
jgi:hypothetical protein